MRVLSGLVVKQQQNMSLMHMMDDVKKAMDTIPLNKDLCDQQMSSSTSSERSNPQQLHKHNYTFKFQTNTKQLPSYFKRQSGLSSLFPNRDINTYLAVIQHTLFDQSVFNPQTYTEREVLSRNFVAFASLLVQVLGMRFGKWADFVDPASGTGFFEENSHGGFVSETDEILAKQAGLQVRDLGCCRVLAGIEWGTKVWLGSFVTEASRDEVQSAIQIIMAQQKQQ
eukprot:CAMPEP_0117443030 /NCGR_PEP_ID=MMETSP0759-20121206/4475_1 /TAXON_ID=63605 /ORGANISM="Percolomonas cosmopolitus, Strain WS" /LENGTH=224 /DNA_ID=CAMNT_0005234973 /DNA_START=261 /DNA_END=938 /DNA_ORIENTATION=+